MISTLVLSEYGSNQTFAGYSLFLVLIIDRLHHYIKEWRGLRKNIEAVMKQNRSLEEAKTRSLDDTKANEGKIVSLTEQIKKLESDLEEKEKSAQINEIALRKQSEGLLLEYDRLLEENQNLRGQLQSMDHHLSHSDSKKNA